MLPFTLPYIFTGLRLAIGVAWMVIVAAKCFRVVWVSAILFGKKVNGGAWKR